MDANSQDEIICFGKCLAVNPPTQFARGIQSDGNGEMKDGTFVRVFYYSWNDEKMDRRRIYAYNPKKDTDWYLVHGEWLPGSGPIRT